jgi:serine/threonine protein kinase
MIKLSSTAGMLPRSLYVHGVDIRKDNPVAFGAMAEVFVGIQPVNGQRVALKRVRLHDELAIKVSFCSVTSGWTTDRTVLSQRLLREALVWRQLRHPSILPFIGVDRETFAASHQLCLVSPWMRRGTVRQYIQSEDYAIHRVQDLHGIVCPSC